MLVHRPRRLQNRGSQVRALPLLPRFQGLSKNDQSKSHFGVTPGVTISARTAVAAPGDTGPPGAPVAIETPTGCVEALRLAKSACDDPLGAVLRSLTLVQRDQGRPPPPRPNLITGSEAIPARWGCHPPRRCSAGSVQTAAAGRVPC
jgi:hypothetical protein